MIIVKSGVSPSKKSRYWCMSFPQRKQIQHHYCCYWPVRRAFVMSRLLSSE
ncbi:hypothetical protein EC960497_A0036 [Escherichia coli 96.0497]|nr:hypothetical protein EC960497_A0036 [Escherichia coli 96.0497]